MTEIIGAALGLAFFAWCCVRSARRSDEAMIRDLGEDRAREIRRGRPR